MSKDIVWSPAAEEDLEKILDYLKEKWDYQVVSDFLQRVETNVSLIIEQPKIFPFINEEWQVRKSVITKHNTLFYRENDHKIEIVRLFDSRQNPKKLKFD